MTTRVYSPSSTELFSKCPRRWALSRSGWKPRVIQYPELCAILGEGFSASMHELNTCIMAGRDKGMAEIVLRGQSTIKTRLDADIAAGRRIHEKDVEYADKLPMLLDKAVQLYLNHNPLTDWKILQSEETYPNHGRCRLDVLADDGNGPSVVDYKVKVKLESRWEDAEFAKFARSQQRFHYQWAAQTPRFYIVLVVLGPRPYVKLSPPYGDMPFFESGDWQRTSRSIWVQMASMEPYIENVSSIPGSAVHDDKFGPCEYEDACFQHNLDPQSMRLQFVKLERRS